MRHRRLIAVAATLATAAFWVVHAAYWHWPYRLAGVALELPLLAVAAAAGIAVALLPWRWAPKLHALGPCARGAGAGLVAFLAAQGVDPFVAERSWLYAPKGCDLAVAFPRRAEIVAGEIRLAGKTPRTVTRALLTDVGDATTLSAECVAIGRVPGDAEKPALLGAAEALLTSSAKRLGLRIERVARAGDNAAVLVGTSDEGRTATNEVLLRRGEGRAVLGASSILVLWAWRIGRAGETAPFAAAFFAGVHPVR